MTEERAKKCVEELKRRLQELSENMEKRNEEMPVPYSSLDPLCKRDVGLMPLAIAAPIPEETEQVPEEGEAEQKEEAIRPETAAAVAAAAVPAQEKLASSQ